MAEVGSEYAAKAVADFYGELVSGTPRLDAEVDRIETASPSLSIGTLPAVHEYRRYRAPTSHSPVFQCWSNGRTRAGKFTRSCDYLFEVEIACELRLVPIHVAASNQPQHLEAGMERWETAIWAATYGGCGGATRVTSVDQATTLNKRVLHSTCRDGIRHTPLYVEQSGELRPARTVSFHWTLLVVPQPANT